MIYEKHIALICNPTPEGNKAFRLTDQIAVSLTNRQVKHSVFTIYWPQVWNDITDVWIIGGDGTLNYFINQYPEIKLPLSVFKGGTGNDFHWMLYGDIEMEKQIQMLLNSMTQLIDAGICNGQLFLNGVGIGFDGAIVKDLLGKKKLAGKASYLISILKNIVVYTERNYSILIGGEEIIQDCFMISVANAKRYGGAFQVAPKASVSDQLLDVNIVGRIAPLKRITLLPVIEKGEHLDLSITRYFQTEKIFIQTSATVAAHLDGEFLNSDKFEITCLPKKFLFSV
ncbi:MAG: YegS/Rv2252/BmrU family lipid kinase [Bacteroidota bacterium]|nr:YegS/Rv2252/BmrU family lipid kinase [Bacteroidota bacterium]